MTLCRGVIVALLAFWGVGRFVCFYVDHVYPLPMHRLDDRCFCLYDVEGSMVHMELSPNENMRRIGIEDKAIDSAYMRALIAVEDKRFYKHDGVDVWALLRAIKDFIVLGRVVSGGSTITMQTVRLLAPCPRTVWSKVKECVYAWRLERCFSKKDILDMYLTLAPYGGNIEGVRAASFWLFGHDADVLGPEEVALLLALPRAPTRLRPDRYAKSAACVRNRILQTMHAKGYIEQRCYVHACGQPVPSMLHPRPYKIPHLCQWIRSMQPGVDSGRVFVNVGLQAYIERVAQVERGTMAAVMVVDTHNQEVIAYLGSSDRMSEEDKGYVDYIQAKRSPGSVLKPFIYAMAMDRGLIDAHTRVCDKRRVFSGYMPGNFDQRTRSTVSIKEALRLSLNTPVVYLCDVVGAEEFVEVLRGTGAVIEFVGEPSLSIALGGCGTTLASLVFLYTCFNHDGVCHPIKYADGVTFGLCNTVMAPMTAKAIKNILMHKELADGRNVAIKTGTSHGQRDGWCLGVDGRFVVGVWVGCHSGRRVEGLVGACQALTILERVFAYLPRFDYVCSDDSVCPHTVLNIEHQERLLSVDKGQLRIDHPQDQSVFVCTPGACKISVVVRGLEAQTPMFTIDDQVEELEVCSEGEYMWRPKAVGIHTISVLDGFGGRDAVQVCVVDS